jgi:hypothetical protein
MIGLPPCPPAAGRRTEIRVPTDAGSGLPETALGTLVLHNDPRIDPRKAWSWDKVRRFVAAHPPGEVVLLGHPGPDVDGALDLRGRTTLAQAAAVIRDCRAYVGIDSGRVPTKWVVDRRQPAGPRRGHLRHGLHPQPRRHPAPQPPRRLPGMRRPRLRRSPRSRPGRPGGPASLRSR